MGIPTLLVTGAGDYIGQELIRTLSQTEFRIIAGVNPDDDVPTLTANCDLVISLDYDVASSVTKAFDQQIDYLFLIPSKSEERALQTKRLIAVAIERNIKYIILLSMLDCHARTGILASQFRYMEQYYCLSRCIEAAGIPYTILRVAPLQQAFFNLKQDFLTPLATISIPIGTGAFAPIHCKDISNVSIQILRDIVSHGGKMYSLTGPELLTGVQAAGKAALGLQRPVRFSNKLSGLRDLSWERILDLDLYALISKGFFTSVSSDVFDLVGTKGIKLQEFFYENQANFNPTIIQPKL